ncbi:MAG: hypothetical protein NXI09_11705 [Bacteroidetes bacterium]|nr:hypothetical protein [Bacteroidota bacterium]
MSKNEPTYLCRIDYNSPFLSVWIRVLAQSGWMILLYTITMLIIYFKSIQFFMMFWIPFTIITLLYILYIETKNNVYLLCEIKINNKNNLARIKVRKLNKTYINRDFEIKNLRIYSKKIYSGIGGSPNYKLVVYEKNNKIITQYSNFLWKDEDLKAAGDKLNKLLNCYERLE